MKQLLLEFQKMDSSIVKLMKSGVKFSFGMIIFATMILLAYDFMYSSPTLYYIGFSLFKTALFFMVGFVICAFAFQKIMGDLKE